MKMPRPIDPDKQYVSNLRKTGNSSPGDRGLQPQRLRILNPRDIRAHARGQLENPCPEGHFICTGHGLLNFGAYECCNSNTSQCAVTVDGTPYCANR